MATRLTPLQALNGREESHLVIAEIYHSIQGESTHAGRPCVFVRTTACNQRCTYCDTAWAFTKGEVMALDDVIQRVAEYECRLVEITGGEPLLQPAIPTLAQRLLDGGHEVLIETGGSRDVSILPSGVKVIMDLKTPDSGEEAANDYANLSRLDGESEVKFVVCSRDDFEWAVAKIREHEIQNALLSPCFGRVEALDLTEWILDSGVDARLNLQIHKFIWPPHARGV